MHYSYRAQGSQSPIMPHCLVGSSRQRNTSECTTAKELKAVSLQSCHTDCFGSRQRNSSRQRNTSECTTATELKAVSLQSCHTDCLVGSSRQRNTSKCTTFGLSPLPCTPWPNPLMWETNFHLCFARLHI